VEDVGTFVLFHRGDSILDELGCRFVVPRVPYAGFDLFFVAGVESLDGEEEGGTAHFRWSDSESYVWQGPYGLLHKYLVVDLT